MMGAVAAVKTAYSAGVINTVIAAGEIIPFLFYPFLLAISSVIFMIIPFKNKNSVK